MSNHILIIDDEALLRRSLSYSLEQAGYRVSAAGTAEDGLAIIQQDAPDLILLDIGLPGMDGLEALPYIRQQADAPVIFVTARRRELDEVVGLEMGADDYITKPFDTNILLARVKAVLRRADAGRGLPASVGELAETLTVGDLVIDPNAYTATLGGRELDLSPRVFDVLYILALHAGNVVSVDDLLAQVWGAEYVGEPQVVYVHIRWLREKIEEKPSQPQRILTVRGRGYKLVVTNGEGAS